METPRRDARQEGDSIDQVGVGRAGAREPFGDVSLGALDAPGHVALKDGSLAYVAAEGG